MEWRTPCERLPADICQLLALLVGEVDRERIRARLQRRGERARRQRCALCAQIRGRPDRGCECGRRSTRGVRKAFKAGFLLRRLALSIACMS